MTKRDVMSIALKILGVVAIMNAVGLMPNIGFAIGMLLQPPMEGQELYIAKWQFVISLMWPISTLILGLILVKWGGKFANKLIKDDRKVEISVNVEWEKHIFLVALKIIGVVLIVRGIPEFIKALGDLIRRINLYFFSISHQIGVLASSLALFILGFYLLTGGNAFIKLAFRQPTETETETNEMGKEM